MSDYRATSAQSLLSVFQSFLAEALSQCGKSEEAFATLAEAHKMLSDVYNWFTEGFTTKDLQEAKALMEELSS